MVGSTLGHYHIVEELGRGGMGRVWKAYDTHLNRLVAIKILSPSHAVSSSDRRRFTQEAQAASALNHPNIVTIHDIASEGGSDYIVMEFVAGKTLDQLAASGPITEGQALRWALEISSALARAHSASIIHRDLKPSNIMLSEDGAIKLLDFGLAKLMAPHAVEGATETAGLSLTGDGHIVGTVSYMSPEQAEGRPLDGSSDVFSFGVVLYELLSGQRPFRAASHLGTLMAIMKDQPPPLDTVRPDLSPEIVRIVNRCLAKQKSERYPSGVELHRDFDALQQRVSSGSFALKRQLRQAARRPRFVIPTLAILAAIVALSSWWWGRQTRIRWVRERAIPEINTMLAAGKYVAALDVARSAEAILPDDPRLKALRPDIARQVWVKTEPPGADIYYKDYSEPDSAWRYAGKSPGQLSVPRGYYRWRIMKDGFLPLFELAPSSPENQQFRLTKAAEVPAGMVHVPDDPTTVMGVSVSGVGTLDLSGVRAFWIDKTEVTNREFKRFVDAGGYQKKEYWKQPFVRAGRTLSWDEAMREFRDATGRPGPALWEAGSYHSAEGDHPVRGVSWYEAAAYAEFAGKQLPTIYHWYRAADPRTSTWVVPLSNFKGSGPAPAGQFQGLSPFGTTDMAGNVKEWCFNESTGGLRFILGGAWYEPIYTFSQPDARSPFDRGPANGFRCVRYGEPPAEYVFRLQARSEMARKQPPVSDEAFHAYLRLYSYDSDPLDSKVEGTDAGNPDWVREKVTFRAAYGNERVIGHLLLPKQGKPPYQTVVYHPSASARQVPDSKFLDGVPKWDYLVRSGRAVFHPVVSGSYERNKKRPPSPVNSLAELVEKVQDIQRSADYLLTRPDIDHERLAYAGSSWGAASGAWVLAVERRFKAGVLMDGGFYVPPALSELDQANYAPRVRVPVLMVNGRYDYFFPLETSQKPMLKLLGTPAADKRHVLFETAHEVGLFRQQLMREVLDWLDKYLGPVSP